LRILAFTDVHGNRKNLEKLLSSDDAKNVDVIAFCGDAAPYSNPSDVGYLIESLEKLSIPSVGVPGNMDNPSAYRDGNRFKVIHGRYVTLGGYSFIGLGGSPPTPFGTVFELSEEEIARLLQNSWSEAVKHGPVIVVSHAPPYGTACDLAMRSMHVGSKSLRKFIEENIPLLCICGHIHESRAIDRIGDTVIVNPGPLKSGFYAVIEVRGFEVKRVELKRL